MPPWVPIAARRLADCDARKRRLVVRGTRIATGLVGGPDCTWTFRADACDSACVDL